MDTKAIGTLAKISDQKGRINPESLYTNKPTLFKPLEANLRTSYFLNIEDKTLKRLNQVVANYLHFKNPELENKILNREVLIDEVMKDVHPYLYKAHILIPDQKKIPPVGVDIEMLKQEELQYPKEARPLLSEKTKEKPEHYYDHERE